jgi:hypothetical protein
MRVQSPAVRIATLLPIVAILSLGMAGCRACVDFESPLVLGTKYGAPVGNAPGTVVFTQDGMHVSVQDFVWTNGGGTFNFAQIEKPPVGVGSGQCLHANNINLEFDFTGLGPQPMTVQFEFLDLGGFENISVNGDPMPPFAGELTTVGPSLGGVHISMTVTPVQGGKIGIVTLSGQVKTLRIGGQEFWLDNVCVRNEE